MRSDTMIIDFTALRIPNEAYIVGAMMDYFHIDEEGNRSYPPCKVASLYIDDTEVNSTTKCIKYILKCLVMEVPEGVTQVVFRSNLPHCMRSRDYRKEVDGLIDADIRVKYVHRLGNKLTQLQLLANDALTRKSSVIGVVS
ncbi:hypothetical protein QUF99_11140 [Bacillus sp. DX4.1]|uniref:hypothetical protein n=1 Tax=Bacillus sp. DX4.1 TaxID=3055867 RepID=UPI00259FFCA3|nr:hypothetical protein [Bacillus sp. DX4.1]MDM5187864.1 hypothetical protein [Bacillus sp. DX4.1]